MTFRYFDAQGRQLSPGELAALDIVTPVMEHIFADMVRRQKVPEVEKHSGGAVIAGERADVIQ